MCLPHTRCSAWSCPCQLGATANGHCDTASRSVHCQRHAGCSCQHGTWRPDMVSFSQAVIAAASQACPRDLLQASRHRVPPKCRSLLAHVLRVLTASTGKPMAHIDGPLHGSCPGSCPNREVVCHRRVVAHAPYIVDMARPTMAGEASPLLKRGTDHGSVVSRLAPCALEHLLHA
jgi:hypothetical protein